MNCASCGKPIDSEEPRWCIRAKPMTKKRAYKVLSGYLAWKQGGLVVYPSPSEVNEAIVLALRALKKTIACKDQRKEVLHNRRQGQ